MRDDRHEPGAAARVLLAGASGPGKNLAARALAAALGTDLLAVDVAGVVSTWIGETEERLGAVFDAAERAGSVLFLDEADALFGSRTEVKDAHDRYADLDTAGLLERVRRFSGIVVLAASHRPVDPPEWLTVVEADADDPVGPVGRERTTDGS